jgi:hypothetical protein
MFCRVLKNKIFCPKEEITLKKGMLEQFNRCFIIILQITPNFYSKPPILYGMGMGMRSGRYWKKPVWQSLTSFFALYVFIFILLALVYNVRVCPF